MRTSVTEGISFNSPGGYGCVEACWLLCKLTKRTAVCVANMRAHLVA